MSMILGVDPRTGSQIAPGLQAATEQDLSDACRAADLAFATFRDLPLERRAAFLEAIADEIAALGDELIDCATRETALPRPRLEGERGRTMAQLRLFAAVVRKGDWLGIRIDPALPERAPLPRPDLRLRHVALGPVAVFGASNFPLAFSVAGGDTASALAAGCPVIVKAHPAHPATSDLVGKAVQTAAKKSGMPPGVFAVLQSADHAFAGALVRDPRIRAVGFTGSKQGGLALVEQAGRRTVPIPVYAEMSSINPVIVMPAALRQRGSAIAQGYASALTLGVGQFCTNPGLMIVPDDEGTDAFLTEVAAAVSRLPAATMLTTGIHAAHEQGVARLRGKPDVVATAEGMPPAGPYDASPAVFATSAAAFAADPDLAEEVFGPTGLIVRCGTMAEVHQLVEALEGQLTIAVHLEDADHDAVRALLPLLETKAGRILVNGFGTGVEVAHAMVHGGPFPATSDGRSTSVGTLAIARFLRPVCYQDVPADLLPPALRDDNPWHLSPSIEGGDRER